MGSDRGGFPLPVSCISATLVSVPSHLNMAAAFSRDVCQWCCSRVKGRIASLCMGIILHTHLSSHPPPPPRHPLSTWPKQQPKVLFRLVWINYKRGTKYTTCCQQRNMRPAPCADSVSTCVLWIDTALSSARAFIYKTELKWVYRSTPQKTCAELIYW